MPPVLNAEQELVKRLVLSGHSLFIDGAAGCGKTFLLKYLNEQLTGTGKNVALTCTTGIACLNYSNATTIHRWAGLHDGRYNSAEIKSIVSNNAETLSKIKNTDILIIDEVSMLSLKLFEQLHEICSLRDPAQPWGGIQIIVSGDFKQLPPTPNRDYNDNGEFCFKSQLFEKLHHVTLHQVIRQTDIQLISTIRAVSDGEHITEDVIEYMRQLRRPLSGDDATVKLFAKNDLVNSYNRQQILKHPGRVHEYRSIDSGDKKKLHTTRAQEILWLKDKAPVILIRNLTNTLVNGLQGEIVHCEEDGPLVHFPSINQTVKVQRTSFSGKPYK